MANSNQVLTAIDAEQIEKTKAMQDAILMMWDQMENYFPFIMFKKCIAEYEEVTGDHEFKRSLLQKI
jgi:hypothetical protein